MCVFRLLSVVGFFLGDADGDRRCSRAHCVDIAFASRPDAVTDKLLGEHAQRWSIPTWSVVVLGQTRFALSFEVQLGVGVIEPSGFNSDRINPALYTLFPDRTL